MQRDFHQNAFSRVLITKKPAVDGEITHRKLTASGTHL